MMVIKLISTAESGNKPLSGWLILGPAGDSNRFIDHSWPVAHTDETIVSTYGPIKVSIKVSHREYRRIRKECGV